MQAKRKTHTSSEVKDRYNRQHYKAYTAKVKFDLYDALEAYQKRHGLSRPEFLARAIETLEQLEK
jgi:hypothetical protein